MNPKQPTDATQPAENAAIRALLLTTPGCTHCAALKNILSALLAEGKLAQLDIVDVSDQPDIAEKYSVKSVPWLQLGSFQFQGSLTEKQLREWIGLCSAPDGNTQYMTYLLQHGELNRVIERVRGLPSSLSDLLSLVTVQDLDFKVRLGVSAVFEELQGSDLLQGVLNDLSVLAQHENPQVRADAAHFLALSHSAAALPYLRRLAKDTDNEVREIAEEALLPSPD